MVRCDIEHLGLDFDQIEKITRDCLQWQSASNLSALSLWQEIVDDDDNNDDDLCSSTCHIGLSIVFLAIELLSLILLLLSKEASPVSEVHELLA